jgi:hypothetical protein
LVLDSLQAGESDWSARLKSLKILYLGGVRVDSVGFDRDYARSKIEAPTYPSGGGITYVAGVPRRSTWLICNQRVA